MPEERIQDKDQARYVKVMNGHEECVEGEKKQRGIVEEVSISNGSRR